MKLEERIVCSDGNCVGTINENGICNICGKRYLKSISGSFINNDQSPRDGLEQIRWGYLNLQRGRILCAQIQDKKVILIEPDGGYFYPMPGEVEPAEIPDEQTFVSALTGLSHKDLETVRKFCSIPRTMQEIRDKCPDVEAWRLRKLGILKDVGRRNRRILSEWVGWQISTLLEYVLNLRTVPSGNDNTPA